MIEDPRFWIFFIILFLSAYVAAELADRIRKKKRLKRLFYIAAALIASVGLWLSSQDLYSGDMLFHFSNGAALALGVLIGFFPVFIIVPFLLPLLLPVFVDQPLKPFLPCGESELGTLMFLPYEGNSLKMVWDDGDSETVIELEGEKAGLVIMSSRSKPAFFFLKDRYLVLGVSSESVLPDRLSDYEESVFFSLIDPPENMERFYNIHYPASRFVDPGYFGSWQYTVCRGRISLQRK